MGRFLLEKFNAYGSVLFLGPSIIGAVFSVIFFLISHDPVVSFGVLIAGGAYSLFLLFATAGIEQESEPPARADATEDGWLHMTADRLGRRFLPANEDRPQTNIRSLLSHRNPWE